MHPFYPYTDSPSHKGGGSIIFITTDLQRIKENITSSENQTIKTIDHVAIRIEQGEVVGRGSNSQELLALLEALAVSTRLETLQRADKRIGSDCKSLVDYVNEHRHARMRNEVGKLPFLLALGPVSSGETQDGQAGLRSRRVGYLHCRLLCIKQAFTVTAEQLVRNVFPRQSWYLGTTNDIR